MEEGTEALEVQTVSCTSSHQFPPSSSHTQRGSLEPGGSLGKREQPRSLSTRLRRPPKPRQGSLRGEQRGHGPAPPPTRSGRSLRRRVTLHKSRSLRTPRRGSRGWMDGWRWQPQGPHRERARLRGAQRDGCPAPERMRGLAHHTRLPRGPAPAPAPQRTPGPARPRPPQLSSGTG